MIKGRALKELLTFCDKLAKGDVDFKSTAKDSSEIGAAIADIEAVRDKLIRCRDQFEQLRRSSSYADISAKADVEGLSGIYYSIAERANAYIGSITAYLDVLALPAFSIDLDYNIIYTNKDACGLLNMTSEQLRGKKCYDYFKSSKCRTNDCVCLKAQREDRIVHCDATSHYGGKEMIIKQTGIPIKDYEDGFKLTAGLEVIADVTEIHTLKNAADYRAEQTLYQIDSITSIIGDLSKKTSENMENAERASRLSADTKNDALAGSGRMDEMLLAMEEIKNASAGIANIIKTIESIAFQTNILALNAAVEAARAGEHGRGFAVVAEEVRNLAARSAESAKETTVLIEDTVNKVQKGVQIADETASALGKIVNGISDAEAIVSEIAKMSKDQENAITQIEESMRQIK